jgi:predicted RNA polymerase sigma factor
MPARLDAALTRVDLVFTEGCAARGEALVRPDLCVEAIRLGPGRRLLDRRLREVQPPDA